MLPFFSRWKPAFLGFVCYLLCICQIQGGESTESLIQKQLLSELAVKINEIESKSSESLLSHYYSIPHVLFECKTSFITSLQSTFPSVSFQFSQSNSHIFQDILSFIHELETENGEPISEEKGLTLLTEKQKQFFDFYRNCLIHEFLFYYYEQLLSFDATLHSSSDNNSLPSLYTSSWKAGNSLTSSLSGKQMKIETLLSNQVSYSSLFEDYIAKERFVVRFIFFFLSSFFLSFFFLFSFFLSFPSLFVL
jgi:hypothetical protein